MYSLRRLSLLCTSRLSFSPVTPVENVRNSSAQQLDVPRPTTTTSISVSRSPSPKRTQSQASLENTGMFWQGGGKGSWTVNRHRDTLPDPARPPTTSHVPKSLNSTPPPPNQLSSARIYQVSLDVSLRLASRVSSRSISLSISFLTDNANDMCSLQPAVMSWTE